MYYIGNNSANGEELKDLRKENSRFWKDVMLEDVSSNRRNARMEEILQYITEEIFRL